MKLTVVFSCKNYQKTPIHCKPMEGLQILDIAKTQLGLDSLRLEDVPFNLFPAQRHVVSIEVPEVIARKTSHFNQKNTVYVQVPPRSLEQFISPVIAPGNILHTEDGRFRGISVQNTGQNFEVDGLSILGLWYAAGFPLKWDPKKTLKG